MPTILGLAALFLLATDALNMDLSLMPGVSAKNLIIYLIFMLLALRMVVSRGSIMVAGQMQGAFIVQIGYATVTWLVAGLLIQYPYYDLVASGIRLALDGSTANALPTTRPDVSTSAPPESPGSSSAARTKTSRLVDAVR
jgi:hypothetical protein